MGSGNLDPSTVTRVDSENKRLKSYSVYSAQSLCASDTN